MLRNTTLPFSKKEKVSQFLYADDFLVICDAEETYQSLEDYFTDFDGVSGLPIY